MERRTIESLARGLLDGELTLEAFMGQLQRPVTLRLGDVTLDVDRQRRCGFPEVVYAEGKSVSTLIQVFHALLDERMDVLATRLDREKAADLIGHFPAARYSELARTLRIRATAQEPRIVGCVAIVTAGTCDAAVAEEAQQTLEWMNTAVVMIRDVGVAGPQRLLERLDELRPCDAVVVIAGMEGALPSLVGGCVACPVIAVPTSVGYGASFGGLAALLGMLNSCAANVAVVNIDAGFKAAYIAGLIAKRAQSANDA
jgi:NCAIR mutase (PurE)-related protein